jgi:large subunit ribosomal protein L20
MTYSTFMHGLQGAGLEMDRKVLADIAVNDPRAFDQLIEAAKQGLESEAKPKLARPRVEARS